jgi:site-specific DNA-methyltransferase (adenine-specific)
MSNDLIVVKVDRARMLLAEARDASQAKQVADLAQAAEVYAKRQKLSEEVIQHAHAVKVDALTLLGEFLKANPPRGAGPGRGHKGEKKTNSKGELVFGLPREIPAKESSNAQALAELKEKDPGLHEQVRTGQTTPAQARRVLGRRKKAEQLEEKAKTAPMISTGAWEICCRDCLEGMHGLQASSVRLAFADPPYNIGVDYGEGHQADQLPADEYLAWCGLWMDEVYRLLAPDGSFWVLINDEWAEEFSWLLRLAGFHRCQWLIWYESFGVNCVNRFNRCSRHLFWMVKDRDRFVFHETAVLRPSDRETRYGDRRAQPGGKIWDSVWGINPPIPRLTGTAAERLPGFPTQLPLALLTPIVACASDPGDLVLDPFTGSGTTGAAALQSGRRFLGFEKSAVFAARARARLAAIPTKDPQDEAG